MQDVSPMNSVHACPSPTLGFLRQAILLALILLLGASGLAEAGPEATGVKAAGKRVVARGRIEPMSRVRVLSVPIGNILEQVLVRAGDPVEMGQLVAHTKRLAALSAAVRLAEERLSEAESELVRVKAPAKLSEREAQRALVQQRQAEVEQAAADFRRAKSLQKQKLISPEERENKQLALARATQALEQAKAALRALSEVREVDVQTAEAQVEVAKAQLEAAGAERDLSEIRAPIAGTILMLHARAGESADAEGLLQMADLSRLMVIAEVDQRDIARVQVGMPARFSGGPLPAPITGKVVRIANLVFNQKKSTSDILLGRDARIVEVEILPDTPLPPVVCGEVDVLISPP